MAHSHVEHHFHERDRGDDSSSTAATVVLIVAVVAIIAFALFAFWGVTPFGATDTGDTTQIELRTPDLTPNQETAPGSVTTPGS